MLYTQLNHLIVYIREELFVIFFQGALVSGPQLNSVAAADKGDIGVDAGKVQMILFEHHSALLVRFNLCGVAAEKSCDVLNLRFRQGAELFLELFPLGHGVRAEGFIQIYGDDEGGAQILSEFSRKKYSAFGINASCKIAYETVFKHMVFLPSVFIHHLYETNMKTRSTDVTILYNCLNQIAIPFLHFF